MPYAQHRRVLGGLIRSYLAIMDALGVEKWLAHGTLLGWWWNGRAMPWDYDLDVQVSNATMAWMAARLNGSRHAFAGATYLLDINPHHADLTRGDGMFLIDARWVDTANGMFVDITALRQRDPCDRDRWSCKNMHHYATRDLWPMRLTRFEGAVARVPYALEKILVDEYGSQSLVVEEFEGHRWDRDVKEWVRMAPDDRQKSLDGARERRRQAERKRLADKKQAEQRKKQQQQQKPRGDRKQPKPADQNQQQKKPHHHQKQNQAARKHPWPARRSQT